MLLVFASVLFIALVRWQGTLTWLGNFLVYSQPPEPADLILVMGGDFWGPRVTAAAELAQRGFAPLVLISGPPYRDRPEGELAVDSLVKQGYPSGWFAVFGHNETSTLGEVLALRGELTRRHVRWVLVVTSDYHSRRCALLFRLFCPGFHFTFAPAPDSHYHAERWWSDPSSRALFFSEWSKILGSVLVAYPAYRINRGVLALRSLLSSNRGTWMKTEPACIAMRK